MPRVSITRQEWWPVFEFHELVGNHAMVADVEAETLARWQSALDTFDACQREIGGYFERLGAIKEERRTHGLMLVAMAEAVARRTKEEG